MRKEWMGQKEGEEGGKWDGADELLQRKQVERPICIKAQKK